MRRRPAKRQPTVALIDRIGGRKAVLRLALLAGLGLVGAYLAFALAVSGVARQRSPQQALAFIPQEGVALAARNDLSLLSGRKVAPAAMQRDALAALRNLPLNAKAIRLLAISVGLQGDEARANRLVDRAAHLTRRDILTQVLLIEAAVRRDDLRGALTHFDMALRSSANAPQILFPRLTKAIANPEVRAALKPYIRSNSGWPINFLFFAKNNSEDLGPVVDLVIETGGVPDAAGQRTFDAELLRALFDKRSFSDLKRFLAHVPGASPELLTSAALNGPEQSRWFGPAAWQPVDDAESGAALSGGSGGKSARPLLSIYANPGATRPVAQKLLFLAPGRYRFAFRIASIDRGEGGLIGWHLRCLEPVSAQPIWRMETVYKSMDSVIDIGASCRVQQLQLLATGGTGQTGIEASIDTVSLIRAGGAPSSVSSNPAAGAAPVPAGRGS